MLLKNYILILALFYFTIEVFGQDTLVFLKKDNSGVECKMPLSQFTVLIVTNNKERFNAEIKSYDDNSLTVKRRGFSDEHVRNYNDKKWELHYRSDLTRTQKDSILHYFDFNIEQTIQLTSIKYIKVKNSFIKEKIAIRTILGVGAFVGFGFEAIILLKAFSNTLPTNITNLPVILFTASITQIIIIQFFRSKVISMNDWTIRK